MLGVGEDGGGTPRRIEHHLSRLKLGDIVVEAAHLERARGHEAVAARLVARFNFSDFKMNYFWFLSFRAEGGDDRMQRPNPLDPRLG